VLKSGLLGGQSVGGMKAGVSAYCARVLTSAILLWYRLVFRYLE